MRRLFYVAMVITLITSCENDQTEESITPVETSSYMPLEVGNYWVYTYYKIDTLGNETDQNKTDSVVITKDTLINGNQYYVIEGTDYYGSVREWDVIDILRDSSGYIVNEEGKIRFSEDNFTDTLYTIVKVYDNDTIYTITCKMEEYATSVSVPAGEFEVLNYQGTVTTPEEIPGVAYPRYVNKLYSKDVGIVFKNYILIYSNAWYIEKRLLRYNIENE